MANEVVLGQDFGHNHSKLVMARCPEHGRIESDPVPFLGDLDDDNQPETNSAFEYIAAAAWTPNGMIEGKPALARDVSIPLKSMLAYWSGIRRPETLNRIASGAELRRLAKDGKIKMNDMRNIILQHFRRLRQMADRHAARRRVTIGRIALTYPNYLCPVEKANDFDRYMDHYLQLMRIVWGPTIPIFVMSEGQAVALFLCEPFSAMVHGSLHQYIDAIFQDLDRKSYINLLVVDGGSGTVNYQLVTVWFDEEGRFWKSQPFIYRGQLSGVLSGSHIANDKVKEIVKAELKRHRKENGYKPKEGDVASYVQNFERLKRRPGFNYADHIAQKKSLDLNNEAGVDLRIELDAAQLDDIFSTAFDAGLESLHTEMKQLIALERDFAVVFCGGSYISLGLRSIVTDLMTNYIEQSNLKIRYAFMGNLGPNWSIAPAAGAAAAVATMPLLEDMVQGLTIGVQPQVYDGDDWVGEDVVEVLICQAMGRSSYSEHKIPATNAEAAQLRFTLVCDPLYHDEYEGLSPGRVLPNFDAEPDRAEDLVTPYEFGCSIVASDLPLGCTVRFQLTGTRLEALINGQLQEAITRDGTIPVILSIYHVNAAGRMMHNPRDKKYVLTWKVDPVSKFPIVGQEQDFKAQRLPFWCSNCPDTEHKKQRAWVCTVCKNYSLCMGCRMSRVNHPHEFKEVEMDP